MGARTPRPSNIRPRFDLVLPAKPELVLAQLQEHLDRTEFGCRGWVADPYAELEVPAASKRLWSPRLAIHARGSSQGCTLHCRYQPEPNLWTLYMAIWGMLAVTGASAIAWVCATWIMGAEPIVPLACVGGVVVMALALYAVALGGQRLGADQMQLLRDALQEGLGPGSGRASAGRLRVR